MPKLKGLSDARKFSGRMQMLDLPQTLLHEIKISCNHEHTIFFVSSLDFDLNTYSFKPCYYILSRIYLDPLKLTTLQSLG